MKSNRTSLLVKQQESLANLFKTVCYPDVGCFYTGPPFFQIPFRPISPPPSNQEGIETTFLLYTRKNRRNPVVFTPLKLEPILKSHFNSSLWTRLIVHGFLDGTYTMSWNLDLKDQFLLSADENVIVVDTSSLSLLLVPRIIYPQTVADSRAVGVQVAQLITFLHENLGVDMGKIHIIGHSLGAHIGGYAGERLPKLGRITGLDPAGPWYRKVPKNVELDDTDATFVDVIHSNPAPFVLFGFGTDEDRGHINFWPSGGIQRGYFLTLLRVFSNGIFPTESFANPVNWAHVRATEFFLYSFNQSNCLPVGVECTSWSDFLQGQCNCGLNGERCSFMGMFATLKPPPKRRYYLQVARERPYCLHQYQIVVYLQNARNVTKSVRALIHTIILGENQLLQKDLPLNIDLSIPRQTNTFFATSLQRLGRIRSVEVDSIEDIVISSKAFIEAVEVNYLFPEPRRDSEVKFCPSSPTQQGKLQVFSSDYCGLFKTVCYPDVGCFYTGPPFFQIPYRPINRAPSPPEMIRATFLHFTRKNKHNPMVIAPEKPAFVFKSHLNPEAWTRIIIHGYLDGSYSVTWMFDHIRGADQVQVGAARPSAVQFGHVALQFSCVWSPEKHLKRKRFNLDGELKDADLKDEFLRSADDNVIVVDSSSLSLFLLYRVSYIQASTDTRVIGAQVANLITFLHKNLGVDLKKVHIVGHSLGTEVAGYAGERLSNLGRITALEPAGPLFRYTDRKVQIDDSDATFMDAIHTDAGPITLLVMHVIFCKHQKVVDMFMHSFNQSNCMFVGVECTSWKDFLQGKCNCGDNGERCSFMGAFATPQPPPRRRYYLQVTLDVPFCLHQYQIVVYIETRSNISKSLTTSIHVTAFGEYHLLQEKMSLNVDLSASKQINTFLVFSYQPVGRIHSVEVSVPEGNERATIALEAIEINYLYPM
ncbi:uncharacterized protein LOC129975394 [Argiope bruennichi]|uniref:uncharacterized protein LOC129975394 n=1 Tax=Argiope bruennichi TaxID=94029 RepID=UPI00249458DF|nr:uncharacterized protein LOC129975394 [Argiope bruennichi]